MPARKKSPIKGVLLGAALGAAYVMLRDRRNRRNPLNTPSQLRINNALDKALNICYQESVLRLTPESKFIIFSDLHRGARDAADDFQPCEPTYLAALDYYFQNGFTLILLGDVEELWENHIQPVMESYQNVLLSEQRFYPERYIRIVGNHDNAWNVPGYVTQYLHPLYPGLRIAQGLVLEYEQGAELGEIFLAHGHQGTLDSDFFGALPPLVLPYYRRLQNSTRIGQTSPSMDNYLRGEHDTQMYRWASQRRKFILIAGHTHRPVWSSLTHLDQLYLQLYALRQRQNELGKEKYDQQVMQLRQDIEKRASRYPPVNDTFKTVPCYFNDGCCRFSDGDITGIEITGREISLVKWARPSLSRMEPIAMPLDELFAML